MLHRVRGHAVKTLRKNCLEGAVRNVKDRESED